MTAIILRRRKLGRGSSKGITDVSTTGIKAVRNWRSRDWAGLGGVMDAITVFRWGCTSSLTGLINPANSVIVNTAESIHWCANKKQGRLDMQAAGVQVPETWAADRFQHEARCTGDMRFVLRPSQHAQGRNLVAGNRNELVDTILAGGIWTDGYISKLIDKVAEYRVFVCQNRAVWVAKKTPGNPDDVAWNVAQGGRFDNVRWGDWPMAVVVEAMKAAKVSGTDFCGVDVMVDADGNPYVLEVNSAPSQTSPYRQQCVAKAFDYIVANGKQHFDDVENAQRWRDVIHPALLGDENGND